MRKNIEIESIKPSQEIQTENEMGTIFQEPYEIEVEQINDENEKYAYEQSKRISKQVQRFESILKRNVTDDYSNFNQDDEDEEEEIYEEDEQYEEDVPHESDNIFIANENTGESQRNSQPYSSGHDNENQEGNEDQNGSEEQ
jgi:hypothetical protein